ncbi:hypothetical protein IQ266_23100 [filamentous cyanobacterium LEGE 11480]|uniref:Uncharacterized protein n=1 Tax=Romeriopsis navalis LEGE 11480 TaxID=2777977 RepID=A0A928Z6W8_9CYAN|nr:ubiquinone biosynthesis protein COQ4 [Romeriopsis navalis]MBE9032630.1 hypothetical protein [Romeriopsis navalis LEGE 11480]
MPESERFHPSLTLGEALQIMRSTAPEATMTQKMSATMAQIFEQHDAVHILFDCGTSIQDEIAVHLWMNFGTTANLRDMHQTVANQEHQEVLSSIGHFKLLGIWCTSLPRIIQIMLKCWQMQRPIDISALDRLKPQTIHTIRSEHGIEL